MYHEKNLYLVGRPGTDYPILSTVPYTNFYCDEQLYPGFFADMETRCQGKKFETEQNISNNTRSCFSCNSISMTSI